MQSLVELAMSGNGYVTATTATKAGVPRRKLTESVNKGDLVYLERGLYALPEVREDPYFVTQHRFARGIYSDDTALFLHGMTDRVPLELTMTFPRSYNGTAARKAGIHCRTCAPEHFNLGVMEVETMYGNKVNTYDLERTLCDLVRGHRLLDVELVTPAMQRYVASPNRNTSILLDYSRALGVESKIRTYLEALQ